MDAAFRSPDSGSKPVAPHDEAGAGDLLRALGPYRILRLLGSGGMSDVYLAYDDAHRRQVAIKVLSDRLSGSATFVNRFQHEAKLCRQLTHPNLVKAFDSGQDRKTGKHFIVMEFVDGCTAQDRLEREGCLPVADAVRLVIDIGQALEMLHLAGYVHRDVKPGNILIGPDGDAKLIDLGVAKKVEPTDNLTALDQHVGTPFYMPWEQSSNAILVDARSDIFALGATFYHLLTGAVPFPGDDENAIARAKVAGVYLPLRTHRPHLNGLLESLLERMLAKEPRKRFSDVRDIVDALSASGLTFADPDTDLPLLVPQPLAPTKADLKSQVDVDTPLEAGDEQVWVVKFRRPGDASWRKLRGRTPDIARMFKEGDFPEEVFAAREPSHVYRRLRAYPEFRNVNRRLMASIGDAPPNRLRKVAEETSIPSVPLRCYAGTLLGVTLMTGLLCALAAGFARIVACWH